MPRARAHQQQQHLDRGDIVQYRAPGDAEPHTWDVLARGTRAVGTANTPTVHLERFEQRKTSTPYGRPQRYKRVRVQVEAPEGRCLLVAHQPPLFEREPDQPRSESGIFDL